MLSRAFVPSWRNGLPSGSSPTKRQCRHEMSDNLELAGRVAVVTGGSGAIGAAIVKSLQRAGANAISLDVVQSSGHPVEKVRRAG